MRRRQMYFGENLNDLGFLLLKTDKPIYKPSQTGTYTHDDLTFVVAA